MKYFFLFLGHEILHKQWQKRISFDVVGNKYKEQYVRQGYSN